MYFFFDTETTGLPLDWKAPVSDLDNWPRLVQVAWAWHDISGNRIFKKDYIIKPQGFTIPKFSTAVHHISNERAEKEGFDLKQVLKEFISDLKKAKVLVAHNMEFDLKVLKSELIRNKIKDQTPNVFKVCTMRESVNFCKIEGSRGYKWPTLSELYCKLFKKDFDGAHNAAFDVDACVKSFFQLRKKQVIDGPEIIAKEEEYIQERNIRLI